MSVLKPSKYRAGGLGVSSESPESPEQALKLLQATRKQWDEHLAKFDSAADRLTVSLDILSSGQFDKCSCPLLFPGDGGHEAVLQYHVKADPRAIKSAKLTTSTKGEVTKTILGHFVSRFLSALREDCEQEIFSGGPEWTGNVLDKLFEHCPDTEAFTKPLDEVSETTNTYRHFYFSDLWDKSLVDNVEACAKEFMRLKSANDPVRTGVTSGTVCPTTSSGVLPWG